jgi:hypothetical protein
MQDGAVQISLLKPSGSKVLVEFAKKLNGSDSRPSRVRVFTREDLLLADVVAVEFSGTEGIRCLPRKIRLDTYSIASTSHRSDHMATWEYDFPAVKVNEVLEEGALAFDPTTVDTIWDEANNVFITVPR